MEEHTDVLLRILERDERSFRAEFQNGDIAWLAKTDIAESERDYLDLVADGETISLLVRREKLLELGMLGA